VTNSVVLNTVTLSWTPATTGGTVQSYIIEASYEPAGAVIASLATNDASTTMVVSGVQQGIYYVRVRARNVMGTSAPSPATTVTVGPCTAPGAPTSLAYTLADNLVTLTWAAPASGVTQGYWLYAGTGPGLSNALVTSLGPAPTFSGAANLGTYYVRLAARNSCSVGPQSAELQVVVTPCAAAPDAPTNLQWSRNGSLVTLTWSAPTTGNLPSRYVIEAGTSDGGRDLLVFPTTNNATSFVASAAVGTYYVRVRGRNNCGDSTPTADVVVH
jgi:predicted phage tail protein